MPKKPAELIVAVHTPFNGCYSGVLSEVVSERDGIWHGKILINGILEPACHSRLQGGIGEYAFKVGETIEVGDIEHNEDVFNSLLRVFSES